MKKTIYSLDDLKVGSFLFGLTLGFVLAGIYTQLLLWSIIRIL
jgi:hypothetical protein